MAESFEIVVYQGRTTQHEFTLYRQNESTGIALQENQDIVRFKMSKRQQNTPDLDLDTLGKTANGSHVSVTQFTSPATALVTFAQADTLSLVPGTYDAEVTVIDNSVTSPLADPALVASIGVVHVIQTSAGDIGIS